MEWISILLVGFTLLCVIYLEKVKHPVVKKVLEWVPAILFAYIIPAIVTHLFHLDLSKVALHTASKNIIMPFVILEVLNLFTGWIGGSTSQLILKELSGCTEQVFLVILVMDNVLVNIWTILMFQKIKRSDAINRYFGIDDKFVDFVPDQVTLKDGSIHSALWTIAICLVAVCVCYFILESFLGKVVLLSILGLFCGNFLKFWNHSLMIKGGGYLIILIMAILGLKLNFNNFSLPGSIVLFSVLWLISHYVIMMVLAYLLKLNKAWVPVASMANVGGISTAPAVTPITKNGCPMPFCWQS